MNINVPTPQANGAMISISIAQHFHAAVAAVEIFDGALEVLGHDYLETSCNFSRRDSFLILYSARDAVERLRYFFE